MKDIEIEYLPVDKLIPYVSNSRKHDENQVLEVMASINEFGFTNPILLKSDNSIIAGHCRLMAAKRLEMEKVPCIYLSHLSEAQARALVIVDNQLALNASWDKELLSVELKGLEDLDFDMEILGFRDDLEKMMEFGEDLDVEKVEGDIPLAEEIDVDKEYLVIVFDDKKNFDVANEKLNNQMKVGYWLSKHKKNPAFFLNGPNRVMSGELFLQKLKEAAE